MIYSAAFDSRRSSRLTPEQRPGGSREIAGDQDGLAPIDLFLKYYMEKTRG
ncbi:MAG TPA: hypothetical protein VKJ01_23930 [Candidatus Solibacter sp.]|nr:hypothetical protein [Candidatus Solibacter sp.]